MSLDGLDADFRDRLSRFLADARGIGVSSGYRSPERQAQLFRQAIGKYGSEEAARKWVAPPGRSNHNHGLAADLAFDSDDARSWAHANAGRYGLVFPMGHEPWHIEPAGARSRKGGDHHDGADSPGPVDSAGGMDGGAYRSALVQAVRDGGLGDLIDGRGNPTGDAIAQLSQILGGCAIPPAQAGGGTGAPAGAAPTTSASGLDPGNPIIGALQGLLG